MITKEQANTIMSMARELEDTGRLKSLVTAPDEFIRYAKKNREIHCALRDYLDALTEDKQ